MFVILGSLVGGWHENLKQLIYPDTPTPEN